MDINQLKKIPLFASLPDQELRSLIDLFQAREYPAGATLFAEGDPGQTFTLVQHGEIEILKAVGTPEERLLAVVSAGDYMGEMSLLDPAGRRTASARTRTPVHALEMSRAGFEALLDRHPRLAFEFTRALIARLHGGENATIRDLQAKNRELARAYQELQAAQAQLIEQEKLAHELEIARRIQASLLPEQLPAIPGWQVDAHWQPARAVGGDFYDFIEYPGGRFGLVIADVSGKGVPAALVMATTRSVFRAAAERLVSPGAVLEQVNHLLTSDMPPNMFVTCLYALFDPASGVLDFANAGHNLPCLCSPDGVVELRATGMPLGLLPGMTYEQRQARLAPAHSLLMYSDGLTESHSPAGEMFGLPRLHAFLEQWYSPPSPISNRQSKINNQQSKIQNPPLPDRPITNRPLTPSLIPSLLDALAVFTGPDWDQEDDVTLLTLEPTPIPNQQSAIGNPKSKIPQSLID